MDAIDEIYVVDLGWPFTSDKLCTECRWCHMGAVFMTFTEKRLPVHDFCMKDIRNGGVEK
jgi:hypothetical protein